MQRLIAVYILAESAALYPAAPEWPKYRSFVTCRGTVTALSESIAGGVFHLRPGTGHSDVLLTALVDLDIATEEQANAELRAAFHADRCKRCIVDASGVFVDVRGTAVLLANARIARELGLVFAVIPSTSLRKICRVSRIGDALVLLEGPDDLPGGVQS